MHLESLDVIIYFPLGDELGKLFSFHLDRDVAEDWIWHYWYNIYCQLNYISPAEVIESYNDMLGSIPDETYRELIEYVDPLDPIQINNAINLLRIAIKYNQIKRVGERDVIMTCSIEDHHHMV